SVEYLFQIARGIRLRIALPGEPVDLAPNLIAERGGVRTEVVSDGHEKALAVVEGRGEEMEIVDDGIAVATGERDGVVERLTGFDGQSGWIDNGSLWKQRGCPPSGPIRQKKTRRMARNHPARTAF